MDSEDLPIVFLPLCDGEFIHIGIEELYRSIAASCEYLIRMDFRPGRVEDGILCVVPISQSVCAVICIQELNRIIPFLSSNSLRSQL